MAMDREAIAARLQARLTELLSEDAMAEAADAPVELDQEAVGRLSRMDALQVQAMADAARARRRQERDRVHAALRRLETGEFGWCLTCGEEIAPARLLADPSATRCIVCAEKA